MGMRSPDEKAGRILIYIFEEQVEGSGFFASVSKRRRSLGGSSQTCLPAESIRVVQKELSKLVKTSQQQISAAWNRPSYEGHSLEHVTTGCLKFLVQLSM